LAVDQNLNTGTTRLPGGHDRGDGSNNGPGAERLGQGGLRQGGAIDVNVPPCNPYRLVRIPGVHEAVDRNGPGVGERVVQTDFPKQAGGLWRDGLDHARRWAWPVAAQERDSKPSLS
jgi:hypothetical protein